LQPWFLRRRLHGVTRRRAIGLRCGSGIPPRLFQPPLLALDRGQLDLRPVGALHQLLQPLSRGARDSHRFARARCRRLASRCGLRNGLASPRQLPLERRGGAPLAFVPLRCIRQLLVHLLRRRTPLGVLAFDLPHDLRQPARLPGGPFRLPLQPRRLNPPAPRVPGARAPPPRPPAPPPRPPAPPRPPRPGSPPRARRRGPQPGGRLPGAPARRPCLAAPARAPPRAAPGAAAPAPCSAAP